MSRQRLECVELAPAVVGTRQSERASKPRTLSGQAGRTPHASRVGAPAATTPLGLAAPSPLPRVVPAVQPWAMFHNRVAVELDVHQTWSNGPRLELLEKAADGQRFDAVLGAEGAFALENYQAAAEAFHSGNGLEPFEVV